MNLLVNERDPVVLRAYFSTFGKFCGKYTAYVECWGENQFQLSLLKRENKIKYVTETTKQCPLCFTGSASFN